MIRMTLVCFAYPYGYSIYFDDPNSIENNEGIGCYHAYNDRDSSLQM